MLPSRNDSIWRKVVTAKKKPAVSNLGLRLLLTSIDMRIFAAKESPASVEQSMGELHAYLTKYSGTLKDDLARILASGS